MHSCFATPACEVDVRPDRSLGHGCLVCAGELRRLAGPFAARGTSLPTGAQTWPSHGWSLPNSRARGHRPGRWRTRSIWSGAWCRSRTDRGDRVAARSAAVLMRPESPLHVPPTSGRSSRRAGSLALSMRRADVGIADVARRSRPAVDLLGRFVLAAGQAARITQARVCVRCVIAATTVAISSVDRSVHESLARRLDTAVSSVHRPFAKRRRTRCCTRPHGECVPGPGS